MFVIISEFPLLKTVWGSPTTLALIPNGWKGIDKTSIARKTNYTPKQIHQGHN